MKSSSATMMAVLLVAAMVSVGLAMTNEERRAKGSPKYMTPGGMAHVVEEKIKQVVEERAFNATLAAKIAAQGDSMAQTQSEQAMQGVEATAAEGEPVKGLIALLNSVSVPQRCHQSAERWSLSQEANDARDLSKSPYAEQLVEALKDQRWEVVGEGNDGCSLGPIIAEKLFKALKANWLPVDGLEVKLLSTPSNRGKCDGTLFNSVLVIDSLDGPGFNRFRLRTQGGELVQRYMGRSDFHPGWFCTKDVELLEEEPDLLPKAVAALAQHQALTEVPRIKEEIKLEVLEAVTEEIKTATLRSHCLTRVLMQACLDSRIGQGEIPESMKEEARQALSQPTEDSTKKLGYAFMVYAEPGLLNPMGRVKQHANDLCGEGDSFCTGQAIDVIHSCKEGKAIWCGI